MTDRHIKIKQIAEVLGYIILTLAICFMLQALTRPKYMSHPVEGALVAEYYEAETEHDVIFIGDCEFYEGISPIRLWEGFGISSYVRGSPQQLIWQSYYMLKDTFEIEKPKVVVFNVMELKYAETQSEAYTRLCLDDLKSLKWRLAAAKASLKEENETLTSYVFPLLRYHSRWSDLSSDDIKYMFYRDRVSYNGYLMHTEIDPQTSAAFKPPLFNSAFPELCWEYLDKIKELCEENGAQLVLFKAPTDSWQYPWYEEWAVQIEKYSAEKNVPFINGLACMEEMGLDMTVDTYDKGIHLNVYGAEKCADYLGKYFMENCGLTDRRGEAKLSAAWEKVCEKYHEAKGDTNK